MNAAVSLESRFDRTPDGAVWTRAGFDYAFWTRYLSVFDQVTAIARVRDVAVPPENGKRVNGPSVFVRGIPYYKGPADYARKIFRVRQAIRNSVREREAVILRVGSPLAGILQRSLRREKHPFGVEVVGDPHDVFAPGAVQHPLRPFFRWWFTRQLLGQVAEASAVAYVARMLETRYPHRDGAFGVRYSSVELGEDAFVQTPRNFVSAGCLHLLTVGSLEFLYKGTDILIDAVAMCLNNQMDLDLTVVGGGQFIDALKQRADSRGVSARVRFLGELGKGEAVRRCMDAADLFVLPSRTEGLPRAMIEAMARGLPCLGTSVGGIPELLEPAELAPSEDARALAALIQAVASSPERMRRLSTENLVKARDYHDDSLNPRRMTFYRSVKSATEQWIEKREGRPVYIPSAREEAP